MKSVVCLAIGLLSFNAFAQDLAENHAQICAGSKDPCKVIFTVVQKKHSGVCTGKLNGSACSVSFSAAASSAVRVVCGLKDEVLLADAQSYNVSALITKSTKSDVVVNDPQLYTYIEARTVTMFVARTNTMLSAQIVLKDKGMATQLTEVKCN